MRAAMAPTTPRESFAGNRTMAMAETTRPAKTASFQLWATGEKSGGAGKNCAVVIMILWFQGQKNWGAGKPCAPTDELLDQADFLQFVLLELGDVVERGLGILLASDGKVELVLLLRQQFKELRHMPDVLLPVKL